MNYQFTDDWFSHNLPQWRKFLLPLNGTPCRLLEIGSYEGRSSFWMADNLLSHYDSNLVCVDLWEYTDYGHGGEQRFDANHAACVNGPKVFKFKGKSVRVLRNFSHAPQYDFAYIDGSHEAKDVTTDWAMVVPLMKKGGLVCFDDYQWTNPYGQVRRGPKAAIDPILDQWATDIEVIHKGYQVWVKLKQPTPTTA